MIKNNFLIFTSIVSMYSSSLRSESSLGISGDTDGLDPILPDRNLIGEASREARKENLISIQCCYI